MMVPLMMNDDGGLLGVKVGEFIIYFFLFYSIFLFILTGSFLLEMILAIPTIPGEMMMILPMMMMMMMMMMMDF